MDTEEDVCWSVAHREGQLHLVGIERRHHSLHQSLLAGTLWGRRGAAGLMPGNKAFTRHNPALTGRQLMGNS